MLTLTCQRCRSSFESPLRSRYCGPCRGHLARTLFNPVCQFCFGTKWVCREHTATPFDECCGAPIVACICNPEMKSPPDYICVSDIAMAIV